MVGAVVGAVVGFVESSAAGLVVGLVTGLVERSELSVFFVVGDVSDDSFDFINSAYLSSPPIVLMSFEANLNTSLASVAETLPFPSASATGITESLRFSSFAE